jgi:hypothetical protein
MLDLAGQRQMCAAQGCAFAPVSGGDTVGFASLTLGMKPINGLRHPGSGDTAGWYIRCGEDFSDAADFFQPICVDHLIEKVPLTANLLGLPHGYRFLLADKGYVDIWFDEGLLKI